MRKFALIFFVCLLLSLSACTYIEDYVPGQATATPVAPVETLDPTAAPLPRNTLVPTSNPAAPTVIPTQAVTPTPVFTPTPTVPPKPYALQPGALIALPAFTQAGAGCTWMGIGGQVIGEDGQPVKDLVITVEGVQNGAPAEWMGYTGTASAYGPGGFEIQLDSQVAAAQYTIQVFDLGGEPLSEPYHFNTLADCQQNLMLVNFSPNTNHEKQFLPIIGR